jgi:hypothetical protein
MSRSSRLISRHPFDFIPPGWWPRFFWPLLGLTLLLMVAFGVTGAPLTTEAAPYGVVSFELAGNVENMHRILNSWDANTQLRAAFGLGLDFLFMVVYAGTVAFGCGIASRVLQRSQWPLARAGNLLAWGLILAALLDAVENIALTNVIFGAVVSPWPEIARWCALPKFVLLFIGIVYVIYGGVVTLVERLSPVEQGPQAEQE